MLRVSVISKAALCALVVLAAGLLTEGAIAALVSPARARWPFHLITVAVCSIAVFVMATMNQKTSQEMLSNQQKNFDVLVSRLPGLACVVGRNDRLLRWNSRFQETLGYSAAELAKMPAYLTLAEDFRELVPREMSAARTAGGAEMEAAWMTKSGTRIPCYLSGARVYVNNEPCIVSVGIDITRRKKAEDALRQSEEQYRRLLGNLPDVTWIMSQDLELIYVSPNVQSVLGYDPAEVLGGSEEQRAARIHPDDRSLIRAAYEALFFGSHTFDADYRLLHKQGHWVWVHNRALRTYEKNGRKFADGTLRDITERKHAERADSQLASIVHSSTDAIIGKTTDGTIVSWNPAAEAMFGYPALEAVGRNIAMIFSPKSRAALAQVLNRVAHGERLEHFGAPCVRQNGSQLDASLAVFPILDKNGVILGISIIAHDVTLQKRTERELLRAKQAAEAATRAKTEFLADMSQQLRTPMNDIIGLAEQTLDTVLDSAQREYLLSIQTSGNSLLRLVSNVLDFTRTESGALQLEQTTFHLPDMLEQTVRPFTFQAQQFGLQTFCTIDPNIPASVTGDAGRLRQVLVNLIGNAIKFTLQGSVSVQALCRSRDLKAVEVHFRVSDTGIGISPQKLEKLFTPFTQHNGSSGPAAGGTGMGLVVTNQLVNLMGGSITVESEPDQGSTFEFTLCFPIAPPQLSLAPSSNQIFMV